MPLELGVSIAKTEGVNLAVPCVVVLQKPRPAVHKPLLQTQEGLARPGPCSLSFATLATWATTRQMLICLQWKCDPDYPCLQEEDYVD